MSVGRKTGKIHRFVLKKCYKDLEGVALIYLLDWITDTNREGFFLKIPNFWAWADKLGQKISGHFGYFRSNYKDPFWYSESLVHVFHYSTIISTKKLSLYIHILNIYLGLGFDFGSQRFRDLVFVCP